MGSGKDQEAAIRALSEALEDRLPTLARPVGDVSEIQLRDLFNIDEIQKIQDAFALSTGVASIITDTQGQPITKPSNFCRLCEHIIRKTDKGLHNCYRSDAAIGRWNPEGPIKQQCLSGGLWDAGSSICVGDRHIANWLIGQVLEEPVDEAKMLAYAREIGADEDDFREALAHVTRMPLKQFENVSKTLYLIANQLSKLAIQNVHQARLIVERKRAEEERAVIAGQLEVVTILQQSLLEAVPLEIKLANVTRTIVEHFKADFCRIWLIYPGDLCGQGCTHAAVSEGPHACRHREKCLHLLASAGRYTHVDGGHRRVPFGCYKIGTIASGDDHKFLIGDVATDPRVHNREWARGLGLVSFAGYQLRVPGAESIGVLALFSKHPLQPSEDAMLDGLGSAVALAVQQHAADEALRRSRDELEIRVEQRTVALTQSNQNLKDEIVERQKAEGERVKAEAQRDAVEMQLRQAQKLQAVGQLAAGIAHEINTPIQFVNDSVSFLRDGLKDLLGLVEKSQQARRDLASGEDLGKVEAAMSQAEENADLAYLMENAPKAVERSLEGLDRVATIVRSMKEFAHPDDKEMASLDLNRALDTTLTVARNEYKYVADVLTGFGELPLVRCYAGEINQVFLNIIVNASHAIQNVVKDSGQRGLITVRTRQDGDWAVVSIADTGSGIPQGIQNRIYDPFFTTKEVGKGTGQGLAIAWSVVVDKHGGSLRFESTPGNGTTFFIRLPVKGFQKGQAIDPDRS